MGLKLSEAQTYHCLGVIEYMRRQKAIALVGNVCTGKTTVLKIVSMALKLAYGVIFRTSCVNPQTFTKEEFYGPINAFDSQVQKDQDEALKKKNLF
jgi:ABC-type polysaccharide/polyol phosphate transport system ATPase subunit